MKCPSCGGGKLGVVDKRDPKTTNTIRRRRACLECDHRFTTFETVAGEEPEITEQEVFYKEKVDLLEAKIKVVKAILEGK